MKYKKIPVEVEAVLITGEDIENEWKRQMKLYVTKRRETGFTVGLLSAKGGCVVNGITMHMTYRRTNFDGAKRSLRAYIKTLEGNMEVSPGDYVVTGVHGEQYPVKPDIFAKTYEPVVE